MPYMETQLVIKDRVRKGNALIERVVWMVPAPVRGCSHRFKYRLYCGQNGATVVRYDNESGKAIIGIWARTNASKPTCSPRWNN